MEQCACSPEAGTVPNETGDACILPDGGVLPLPVPDGGRRDAGPRDAGPLVSDFGPVEMDSGPPDVGPLDAGPPDAGMLQVRVGEYLKASNTGLDDAFGFSVAVSSDGTTLAVGARFESSAATGVGGNQSDDSAVNAGAVYVFRRNATGWVQEAYLKASNAEAEDRFGCAVALSANGSTLAVGALGEDSASGSNPADNSASRSGAAYLFRRSGAAWTEYAYLKASNPGERDAFGSSVALDASGLTLAVGAFAEASSTTGVGGNQDDNAANLAGAVYVFSQSGLRPAQEAYIKASNTGAGDSFGSAVALSADGSTLAASARQESSAATGVGGDQSNNDASGAGAAYVFRRMSGTWAQEAYVKSSNTSANDVFGEAVSLSADGTVLVVGASGESSSAVGVGGDQSNDAAQGAGAAYVFRRTNGVWSQEAYLKASNTGGLDGFGVAVALSSDARVLAIGALGEASGSAGIGGDQTDDSAAGAGAVYVFRRAALWTQQAYVKASNTGAADAFGSAVSLSQDGTLVVGASGEDSSATGVGGNQMDNSARGSGAVYTHRY